MTGQVLSILSFSWITSLLFEIERWFCHHRDSLLKADRFMYFLTPKGHLVTLTSGQPRSRSRIDLKRSCRISLDASWWKETLWHLSYVSSSYQSKVMEINVYWPYDVIIWPQLTCQGVTNTKLYLNCHPLHNSSSFWAIWRDLIGIWDTSNFICICICI